MFDKFTSNLGDVNFWRPGHGSVPKIKIMSVNLTFIYFRFIRPSQSVILIIFARVQRCQMVYQIFGLWSSDLSKGSDVSITELSVIDTSLPYDKSYDIVTLGISSWANRVKTILFSVLLSITSISSLFSDLYSPFSTTSISVSWRDDKSVIRALVHLVST